MEIPEWVKKSQVGDKVVCIDDRWVNPHLYLHPKSGDVYTIREISVGWAGPVIGETTCFRFENIVNPPMEVVIGPTKSGMREVGFIWNKFKPLTRKPTDISIFTDMLVGSKTSVNA